MLFRLAFRNVRRSIRQYLLYFATLVLAIMVFYIFNAIETQQVILFLKKLEGDAVSRFLAVLNYVSYAVCLVLGFLILYANQFQLRRRKKEMGLYTLMGMKKRSIAILLLGEGILLGLLALFFGLLGGTVLSQLLSIISSRFFEIELRSFQIVFSLEAAIKTVIYFCIIQFAVILISVFSVSRHQIVDLLSAARINESQAEGKVSYAAGKLAAGILFLVLAYFLIFQGGGFRLWYSEPWIPLIAIVLGIAGTFLFFAGLAGFLTYFPQKYSAGYFTKLNYFNIRQLSSKLSTVHRSMAMVCLLIFFTLSIMSVGISAGQQRMNAFQTESSFHTTLMGDFSDTAFPPKGKTVLSKGAYSSNLGFDLSDYADEAIRVDLFNANPAVIKNYDKLLEAAISSLTSEEKDQWLGQSNYLNESMSNHLYIIPLSGYNALRSHMGLPALILAAGHACYYRDPDFNIGDPVVTYLLNSGIQLDYQNQSFLIDPLIESVPLSTDHAITLNFGLIVPDEDISKIIPENPNTNTLINFDFKSELIETEGLQSVLARLNESVQLHNSPVQIFSVLQVQAREMVITVSISYICIYMGLIFLMCSSALLAIQQLTSLEENRKSFLLLSKLGATRKQLHQSVIRQVSSYFALPLGLAIIHTIIGFLAVNTYVQSKLSLPDLGVQSMYIGILLISVYGVYYFLTCMSAIKAIERYTVSIHTSN